MTRKEPLPFLGLTFQNQIAMGNPVLSQLNDWGSLPP